MKIVGKGFSDMENDVKKRRNLEESLMVLLTKKGELKPAEEIQTYELRLKIFLDERDLYEKFDFLKFAIDKIHSRKAASGPLWLNLVEDATYDLMRESFKE